MRKSLLWRVHDFSIETVHDNTLAPPPQRTTFCGALPKNPATFATTACISRPRAQQRAVSRRLISGQHIQNAQPPPAATTASFP